MTMTQRSAAGRALGAALALAICLSPCTLLPAAAADTAAENTSAQNASENAADATDYAAYRARHALTLCGQEVVLDAAAPSAAQDASPVFDEGRQTTVLHTGEESTVSWRFTVPQDGSYAVQLTYLPLEGSGATVTRRLLLDGALPFDEAYNLEFSRVYHDAESRRRDRLGNDVRPAQEELSVWQTVTITDSLGYFGDLYLDLTAGEHELTLAAVCEPMAIAEIRLRSVHTEVPAYADVLAERTAAGAQPVTGYLEDGIRVIEAEDNTSRSDLTMYAVSDNTSAANSPYDYRLSRLNTVGGTKWQDAGQWIGWTVDVPADGFYHLGWRYKQNFVRDVTVTRALTIDGQFPFAEAAQITFAYDSRFRVELAGGDEPYRFYLTAGKHEIRMQVVLGELAERMTKAASALSALNTVNWDLLTFFGSSPDIYKSYQIAEQLPQVVAALKEQQTALSELAQSWEAMTGETDANVSQLTQMALRLARMVEDPDEIPTLYSAFKDDLSSLGDLIANARSQPLLLDYLFLAEEGAALPRANVSFFSSLKYGFLRFLSSFFSDYNVISVAEGATEPITVWIGNGLTGGRDQAQALSQLITQNFTARQGIAVDLQLVPAGTILTATMAGVGPDVALQVGGSDPANYAMRHAVADLSAMPGIDGVLSRFSPAAYEGFRYLGGLYALPETMSFPMLFYRTDILSQLGIQIEDLHTWDDIVGILPILQRKYMNFALPASFNSYLLFLYQNGGRLYDDAGLHSALGEKEALDAFAAYMQFYTDHGTPYTYQFEMRFRTGEIPIGISDYTSYNLLQISAPEISGKWGMTTVPGMKDHSAPASGAGCVLMEASRQKEAAWAFMTWWTDEEAQYQFGRELESVMGAAARYNTANLAALQRLPWQAKDRAALLEQISLLRGVPEVPGGYMSSRDVTFALQRVYNNSLDARATLLGYVSQIDEEMQLKREEFGLE